MSKIEIKYIDILFFCFNNLTMTIDLKDRLYTSSEVAEILGVSLRSVYRYLEEGKLNADIKTATGRHRFSKQNILEFLQPNEEEQNNYSKNYTNQNNSNTSTQHPGTGYYQNKNFNFDPKTPEDFSLDNVVKDFNFKFDDDYKELDSFEEINRSSNFRQTTDYEKDTYSNLANKPTSDIESDLTDEELDRMFEELINESSNKQLSNSEQQKSHFSNIETRISENQNNTAKYDALNNDFRSHPNNKSKSSDMFEDDFDDFFADLDDLEDKDRDKFINKNYNDYTSPMESKRQTDVNSDSNYRTKTNNSYYNNANYSYQKEEGNRSYQAQNQSQNQFKYDRQSAPYQLERSEIKQKREDEDLDDFLDDLLGDFDKKNEYQYNSNQPKTSFNNNEFKSKSNINAKFENGFEDLFDELDEDWENKNSKGKDLSNNYQKKHIPDTDEYSGRWRETVKKSSFYDYGDAKASFQEPMISPQDSKNQYLNDYKNKRIDEDQNDDWLERFRKATESSSTPEINSQPSSNYPSSNPSKIENAKGNLASKIEDIFKKNKNYPNENEMSINDDNTEKNSRSSKEFQIGNGQKKQLFYKSGVGNLKEIAQQVDKISRKFDLDYAFTLHAGLSLHKPIAPFSTIHAYINDLDLEVFEDYLKLTTCEPEEAHVCLLIPKSRSVFEEAYELHGLFVVSNIQLRSDFIDRGLENLAREV